MASEWGQTPRLQRSDQKASADARGLTPYAGHNITGTSGVIAVDKVGNHIRFYDPASLQEIKSFAAPEPAAHELAISHDRRLAFVPLYGDGIYGNNKKPNNRILVIDLQALALADIIELGEMTAPHGMVATSDGKLWVVADIPNKLLVVDPARRSIEAAYECPSKGAHQMALLPDESKVYVSCKEGDLAVFDRRRRMWTASVAVRAPGITSGNGSGSEGVMPAPAGDRLIVIDNTNNDLRVIDTHTDTEVDRVPLISCPPSNPKRSRLAKVMFSPDGRHLVATSYATALAWVIDANDLRRQTVVPVAKGPQGMAFPPDGKSVVVASHDSGLLTRIDLAEPRAVAAYDGGSGIEVLAWF
jgi:DNA-binding beta-propeller fold protein YncE